MDAGTADTNAGLDAAGEGGTPRLALDGFSGPLDHLLTLARAQKIDLGKISLAALVDQLAAALQQAPAFWLERRPLLGRDVLARGRPEVFGVSVEAGQAIDVVEFLWASMALFDDDAAPDTAPVYRPLHLELYAVAEARERILRRLAEAPDGISLGQLLPDPAAVSESEPQQALRRRSAWSSTLIASLELAKQGDVVLGQESDFQPIHVAQA